LTPAEVTYPSFAVVVPAFNEDEGIEDCVRAVTRVLADLPHRSALIVVDDGSRDATVARLEALESSCDALVVVRHDRNRGYGAALSTGTARAAELAFDYVVFMDSDLTNDPAYLPEFALRMADGYDVVKATRRSAGGGYRGVPRRRIVPAAVGNRLARVLYGIPLHDCTNGYRAVRTELLREVRLRESGFAIIMEELHRLRRPGLRYAEVPVVLTNRAAHLRASAFDYRPRALWRYLRYPLLSALARAQRRGS
jgi:dolichol-phosphate mannosyltransferase